MVRETCEELAIPIIQTDNDVDWNLVLGAELVRNGR